MFSMRRWFSAVWSTMNYLDLDKTALLQPKKFSCKLKHIFHIDHDYKKKKKEIYKTVDTWNYKHDQLWFILFWISEKWRFPQAKESDLEKKKKRENLRHHQNVKSMSWAGTRGRGQREKHNCIFTGPRKQEVDLDVRMNSFALVASRTVCGSSWATR